MDTLDLTQFPKTMSGPKAKDLIMAQPSGLLEGQYGNPPDHRKHKWGYKNDDDCFETGGWEWNDTRGFTVRVRDASKQDETLTAGQALDALIAGDQVIGSGGGKWTKLDVIASQSNTLRFVSDAPFRRVPQRPTSKPLTLDNGLAVVVYADRVEADVPGCGKWVSTKRKYETALHNEGWTLVRVVDFAECEGKPYTASVSCDGVAFQSKLITFADIRRVLAAMAELGGGE